MHGFYHLEFTGQESVTSGKECDDHEGYFHKRYKEGFCFQSADVKDWDRYILNRSTSNHVMRFVEVNTICSAPVIITLVTPLTILRIRGLQMITSPKSLFACYFVIFHSLLHHSGLSFIFISSYFTASCVFLTKTYIDITTSVELDFVAIDENSNFVCPGYTLLCSTMGRGDCNTEFLHARISVTGFSQCVLTYPLEVNPFIVK